MHTGTGMVALRRALAAKQGLPGIGARFHTGVDALDAIAPGGAFQGGAVHELLWPPQFSCPTSFALLLAQAAQNSRGVGVIAWSDPERELYLPALSAAGTSLSRLILLRGEQWADRLWMLAECLGCPGVSATVAFVPRLSRIEARRLQLAAERGGGVGVFMRPHTPGIKSGYAAATRWLIQPLPGNDQAQRWNVQLLHGHGGQVGKVLLLEQDRDTRALRASSALADRPAAPATARATA